MNALVGLVYSQANGETRRKPNKSICKTCLRDSVANMQPKTFVQARQRYSAVQHGRCTQFVKRRIDLKNFPLEQTC